jgi:proteasome alpha subunit
VVIGGQADQVTAVLKDQYRDGMALEEAFTVAIAALGSQSNGDRPEVTAAQLEVALLDRARPHRTFRRLTGARLEALLAGAIGGRSAGAIAGQEAADQAAEGAESAGEAGEAGGAPEGTD